MLRRNGSEQETLNHRTWGDVVMAFNQSTRLVLAGLALCVLTSPFGCGKEEKKKVLGPDDPAPGTGIEALVQSAGEVPDPPTHPLIETPSEGDSTSGEDQWHCRYKHVSIADAVDRFPMFDPISEVIWPGAAVQGASIAHSPPDRIPVPRSSGTVLISSTINGAQVSSVTVPTVSQSAVLNAANQIIASQPSSFPANLFFDIQRVQSDSELRLRLKANASFFDIFSASSQFSLDYTSHTSTFLVNLTQSFYTLTFERPAEIADFFASSVTETDLSPFVASGNPPCYISSVTYGRIFYMIVQADESADSVNASLSASFVVGGFSGSAEHVSRLRGLSVKVFAYGGDAGAALTSVIGGIGSLDDFIRSLRDGGVITTGKALSYSVRSVRSDKVVKNGVAGEYDVADCRLFPPNMGMSASQIDFGTLCPCGAVREATLTVTNTGSEATTGTISVDPGCPTGLGTNPCFDVTPAGSYTLQAHQSMLLTITNKGCTGLGGAHCGGDISCPTAIKITWFDGETTQTLPVPILAVNHLICQ